MNMTRQALSAAAIIAASLVFSGLALGECLMVGTEAASVQEDSGQGNYECTLLQTADGPMSELCEDPTGIDPNCVHITPDNANGTIEWFFDDSTDTKRVASVSVYTGGKGSRCNYSYPGDTISGTGLGDGTVANKDIEVTVCVSSTESALDLPASTDLIDTEKLNCSNNFEYEGSVLGGEEFAAAVGVEPGEPGKNAKIALCARSSEQSVAAGLGQQRCIQGCEHRATDPGCKPDPVTGELSLENCAPCEWESDVLNTSNDLTLPDEDGKSYYKTCWGLQNRACIGNENLGDPYTNHYCDGRNDGTFITKSKKNHYTIEVEETDGSTCILLGIWYGRAYYHCP